MSVSETAEESTRQTRLQTSDEPVFIQMPPTARHVMTDASSESRVVVDTNFTRKAKDNNNWETVEDEGAPGPSRHLHTPSTNPLMGPSTTTAQRRVTTNSFTDEFKQLTGETSSTASVSFRSARSLDSIPVPTTVEEFLDAATLLPALQCGLGEELSPAAASVYGGTKPCSTNMIVLGWLPWLKTKAPNYNHRVWVLLATGRKWWVPCILAVCVALPSVMATVGFRQHCPWPCLLVSWLLWGLVLLAMAVCAFVSPGIVPRRTRSNIKDLGGAVVVRVPTPNAKGLAAEREKRERARLEAIAADDGTAKQEATTAAATHPAPVVFSNKRYFDSQTGALSMTKPPTCEAEQTAPVVEFPLSYCSTCCVFKGPRTHHCRTCDNCVDGFDHHCVWTNCCIGKNNYIFFMGALLALHLLGLYHFALTVAVNVHYLLIHPDHNMKDLLDAMYYTPVVMYAAILLFGLFFSPLLLGHLFMRFLGITTVEMLRSRYAHWTSFLGVNPWSRGWFTNLWYRYFNSGEQWEDSRYYYGVTVACALEDIKLDWRIALPPEQQARLLKLERLAVQEGTVLTAGNVRALQAILDNRATKSVPVSKPLPT